MNKLMMTAMKPLMSMSMNGIQETNQLLRPMMALNQLVSVRHRLCYPRIRGPPRPPIPGKKTPEPNKYNWTPIYPLDGKYTVFPLKIIKHAGRDPETGRVVVKTLGGGNKKYFRWIDNKMEANPDGTPFREKVFLVRYDPLRTSKLALVAGGEKIRWIIASETMQSGDIITTYSNLNIPRNPVRPNEGDSHPVGALPIGTLVHNVEVKPGEGGTYVKTAGDSAQIIRRVGKRNFLMLNKPKREICIDQKCMATVGRVSNPYHHTVNKLCAQRSRWLGKRPRSGAWHRKDGYCGRKSHPPRPIRDFIAESTISGTTEKREVYVIQPHD